MVDPIDLGDQKDLAELLKDGGFTLDGKEITLDRIKRDRTGVDEMEKDYTRKTQILSKKQKEVEEALEGIAPWQDIQEYFKENPEKAALLQKIVAGEDVTVPGATKPEGNEEVKKIAEKMTLLEKRLSDKDAREQFNKNIGEQQNFVQSEIENRKKEFPELRTKEILSELMSIPNIDDLAQEEFSDTINTLCKQSHEAREKEKEQIIDDYIKNKTKRTPKHEGPGAPGAKGEQPLDGKALESGEVRRRATQYLEEMQKEGT